MSSCICRCTMKLGKSVHGPGTSPQWYDFTLFASFSLQHCQLQLKSVQSINQSINQSVALVAELLQG